MSGLLDDAQELLERVRAARPGLEAELYLTRGADRTIELQDDAVERVLEVDYEGVGLRLLDGGRQGFAWTSSLEASGFGAVIERAAAQLRHVPADAARGLPGPGAAREGDAELAASLFDATLFQKPLVDSIEPLRAAGAAARAAHRAVTRVLEVSYSEDRGETAVVNTRGVRAHERTTSAGMSVTAMAEAGAETEVGAAGMSAASAGALDFEALGRDAGRRAGALLGAGKLPTGRRAVLFDPWISDEFIAMLENAMCADEVQHGRSMLAGKRGQRVASEKVTLVDDPRLKGGIASALFDDEGVPTRRITMVDKGILLDYFYDTYTGNKDRHPSNGCAGRSSFRGLPSPSSSNFMMLPGALTREELIRDTRDGILVLDVMGMHTADQVSGEFSVGVSGLRVRNGEVEGAVKNAMISGNILEVMRSVDAVADDLKLYSSTSTPTFRAPDLTVA